MILKNYSALRDEMILRDYLALDRTVLANERTLLSYLRTFIGTFSAGLAIVKLFDARVIIVVGFIFMAVSPFFIIFGIIRYLTISKKLKTLDKNTNNKKEEE